MVDEVVGTDSNSYTPVTADVGADLYCKVTATNAIGSASADSNAVGPVTAAGGGGGFTYISDSEAQADLTFTTGAVDTTGVDLLVVAIAAYATDCAISDSKGNTWTALTQWSTAFPYTRLFYSRPTTVGTGHTATVTAAAEIYAAMCFMAFSGSAASPLDSENGLSMNTVAPDLISGYGTGNVTPTVGGDLIISAIGLGAAQPTGTSVADGFTKICDLDRVGQMGLGVGYLIQTTAAAINPSWTLSGGGSWSSANAAFKKA